MIDKTVIRPGRVAAKLARLESDADFKFQAACGHQPALLELHWFWQGLSLRPGAIEAAATDFLETFSDRMGTPSMRELGKTDEAYTAEERWEVIGEFPNREENDFAPVHLLDFEGPGATILHEFNTAMHGPYHGRPNLAFVAKQNHPYFMDVCRRWLAVQLPWLLASFCQSPGEMPPQAFCFHDLPGALLEYLEIHAARAAQAIAMTEVSRHVFDALDFAWNEKVETQHAIMVSVTGDSRFGKSESAKAWAAAHPGRARIVKTPCDNDQGSFYEALADALGVEHSPATPRRELKAAIAFLLRCSGLMLIFDEAHWLLPQNYTARTVPFRLNYVRSQILESGCPVALINTPQFLDTAARRFEKVTGWNVAQWRGRLMREVQLPTELSNDDMLAVVKIHFPSLRESFARRIVAAALISESFLFAVEKIARNARAEARKAGRAQIEAADIDAGIRLAGFKLPTVAPAKPRDVVPAPAPAPVRPPEVAPPSLPSPSRTRAATSAELLGASSRARRPVASPAHGLETVNT